MLSALHESAWTRGASVGIRNELFCLATNRELSQLNHAPVLEHRLRELEPYATGRGITILPMTAYSDYACVEHQAVLEGLEAAGMRADTGGSMDGQPWETLPCPPPGDNSLLNEIRDAIHLCRWEGTITSGRDILDNLPEDSYAYEQMF